MYTIKAVVDGEEYALHDPRVKELILGGNPYFETGDNINGSAEFSVFPTHPYYDKVKKLTTDIIFYRDEEPEFYGRVLYDDEDFSGTKKVFVEGELAFLCDSIQRPKVYHNISVRAYVQDLIDIHNSQVEERKQFVVGRVTVKDSNDSLYRYSNYENTREAFKEKLTSRLGGHLVIRHDAGKRILDYLCDDDYYKENTQGIRFGRNLLDFSKNMNASDLATCIIPLGAKLDEEDQDESLEAISEQRITIADANGGVDYVTDDNAVKEYGKIYKTVIWDDVTQPENLIKHGREYLKTVQFEKMVLEVKAIDLNLTDDSFQMFQVGDKIQCVSAPNGLDRVFPLTKKRTYITSFKNNTITLGDETSNQSYTSSNRETTAYIEKVINTIPSKSEILKQAFRDAQDLINSQVASGHAIHVPEEFIVADNEDYKEKAKNLWRWGLGGLAHYSQGYNGPIDGVAITMDGKINGKMIMAQSIVAETLDVGYRDSVENAISAAESNANGYTDSREKYMMQEVESSLKVLSNQISMTISSTKELVLRKNYITGGEQETLSKDAFTITGDVATVTKTEFLNLNCLKVEFNDTGSIVIEQDVGELPEGIYKISVESAYPESDGNAKRPYYLEYGFTGNRSTVYYSGYEAEEFHSFSKKLEITAASKAVSVKIYGNKGNVAYITNIRCLREIQEFLDEMTTQIKEEVGRIELSVKNTLKDYSTTTEMNSAIELMRDSINLEVSQIYTTTEETEQRYNDAVKAGQNAADKAEENAKSDTSEKLKGYSTTEEVKSAIKVATDNISLEMSKTYTTTEVTEKKYKDAVKAGQDAASTAESNAISAAQNAADKAEENAKSDTDKKLKDYSTTTEMQSAISLAIDSITLQVKSVREVVDQKNANFYGSGAPTSSNKPASDWNSDTLKKSHIGDNYYDTDTGYAYRYTYKVPGLKITFSDDSRTESVNFDYVKIFYEDTDGTMKCAAKLGGTAIAGASVFVPASEFYVYWHTDSSSCSYYGFLITSVTGASGEETGTAESLPNYTVTELASGTYPESPDHGNYGNNVNLLWKCSGTKSGSSSASWERIQDKDISDAQAKADAAKSTADTAKSTADTAKSTAETAISRITVAESSITSEVTRAKNAEDALGSRITQTESSIESKVSAGEIASSINQTAQSVKINASKIDFNGIVTANSYFKILTDGSMECISGKIGGFWIDSTSLYAYATGSYMMEINSSEKKIKVSDGSTSYISHKGVNRNTVVIGGATTTALFGDIDCGTGTFDSVKTQSVTATTASSFNAITSSAAITATGKLISKSHIEATGHFYNVGSGNDLSDLSVRGTKKRIFDTKDYGTQAFYCYEMASPIFGDIGEAEISDDGSCMVDIDDIFQESTNVGITYYVFLQKESDGECWIEEKTPTYFVVRGTPGLKFCFEIKAKQSEYEHMRFADSAETAYDRAVEDLDYDYETEAETIENEEPDYETELVNDMITIINQTEAVA